VLLVHTTDQVSTLLTSSKDDALAVGLRNRYSTSPSATVDIKNYCYTTFLSSPATIAWLKQSPLTYDLAGYVDDCKGAYYETSEEHVALLSCQAPECDTDRCQWGCLHRWPVRHYCNSPSMMRATKHYCYTTHQYLPATAAWLKQLNPHTHLCRLHRRLTGGLLRHVKTRIARSPTR